MEFALVWIRILLQMSDTAHCQQELGKAIGDHDPGSCSGESDAEPVDGEECVGEHEQQCTDYE